MLNADPIPTYSVGELNAAIGSLLERGFAPRFLVETSVSRPQLKKGHLWLTLTDGDASISAVVWASRRQQLSYQPKDGDGVTVVGKLNFWEARANLTVQVLDIRPSLTTVLRLFEQSKRQLTEEGLIDAARRRALPRAPATLAILTSVPSSALADMLRTSRERWPSTTLLVIPIPVQGAVAARIRAVLAHLAAEADSLELDALVLARGGGSREDLAVFDDEELCRDLAQFPRPLVTGIGHDDDLTVADLVADRAATPTAAMVALLPDRNDLLRICNNDGNGCSTTNAGGWNGNTGDSAIAQNYCLYQPALTIQRLRQTLEQKQALLEALSPERWLKRGLVIVQGESGQTVDSSQALQPGDRLTLRFSDGSVDTRVETKPIPSSP